MNKFSTTATIEPDGSGVIVMGKKFVPESRVKELEDEVICEHQAAVDMFCKYDELRDENASLRKVVQAAREWIKDDGFECGYLIYDAIRELDGEKEIK